MKFWLYGIIAAIAINASAKTFYVSATSGSDDNDGTSTTSAYKTIQKAVDATVNGDVVLVAEGSYAPFNTTGKRIQIVGIEGAIKTIIGDVGSEQRIVWYDDQDESTWTNSLIIGFTVKSHISITGGRIQQCVIRDMCSDGGGAVNVAEVENCLIVNNVGLNGAAGDGSVFRNCTMTGNSASGYAGICLNSVMENCIAWGNGSDNNDTWSMWLSARIKSYGHRDINVYRDDPKFVDAANGDYRLAEDSPCIDAGSNAYAATCNDLDDKQRIIGDSVDIGCYEYGSAVVLGSEKKIFSTPKKSAFVFTVTAQSGTGTWKARTTDDWISLTKETGTIGSDKVSYIVSANTNAALRTGHINVNGSIHTVEQAGCGAAIDPSSINAGRTGCAETVSVTVSDGVCWDAASPVAWAAVSPLHGFNSGTVTIEVDPYDVVAEREADIVVGGQTVTVSQRGREMELSHNETNIVASAQSVSLGVTALNDVSWSVLSGADWIQIAHAGAGLGSSVIDLSIAENQSYLSRTGTVSIGTETFKIVQNRTANLSLTIAEDSVNVAATKTAAKTLKITATPDLPWAMTSNCDWLTPIERYRSGAGTTTIAYSIAANPTLAARTGKLTITPIAGSGLTARTLTVSQSAAVSTIDSTETSVTAEATTVTVAVQVDSVVNWSMSSSANWITFEGAGTRTGAGDVVLNIAENTSLASREGAVSIAGHTFTVQQAGGVLGISKTSGQTLSEGGTLYVDVSGSANLNWSIVNACDWVSIEGESNRKGPTTLVIRAEANTGVEARECEVIIGGQRFIIEQEAASTSVEYDVYAHSADVEIGEFDVMAPDYLIWGTTTTNDWIILTSEEETAGDGKVEYITDELDAFSSRIGIVWAGKTPVYVCQSGFEIALGETSKDVSRLSGNGQIVLDTDNDNDQWSAVATVPWITVVRQSGIGDDILQYSYNENTTGVDRVGRILICDKVFTLIQTDTDPSVPRWPITYENLKGAKHTNPLKYDEGDTVTFTAPISIISGYTFSGWSRNGIGSDATGPQTVCANWTVNSYNISFNPNGGVGTMNDFEMVYDEIRELPQNAFTKSGCSFSGWKLAIDGEVAYADGMAVSNLTGVANATVVLYANWTPVSYKITYENTKDVENANPLSYTIDDEITLSPLANLDQWTFVGWSPDRISAGTTGDIVVRAQWRHDISLSTMKEMSLCTQTTGGNANWYEQSNVKRSGTSSWRSGSISHSQSTWMEIGFDGATAFSFWWKVSSESNYDWLSWTLDGVEQEKISSVSEWVQVARTISNGHHTIKFTYSKDGSVSNNDDCGWIDDIIFVCPETVVVTFDLDGKGDYAGGAELVQTIDFGETAELPLVTSNEGWQFMGWPSVGKAISNVVYKAMYAAIPYSITYKDIKGAANANPVSYTVADSVSFVPLNNVKDFQFVGWFPSSIDIGSTGTRTITAIWSWTPSNGVVSSDVTGGDALPVDSSWATIDLPKSYGANKANEFVEKFGSDFELALLQKTGKFDNAGNEMSVWQDYIAGTDPTDSNSVFQANVEMINGTPFVHWKPDLNSNCAERVYTIWGKTNLTDKAWHSPTNESSHFFKVTVEMP